AQDAASTPPGVVAPSAATDSVYPFQPPAGTPMRTGATSYRLSLLRDSGPSSLGVRTIEVTETQLGGIPTWLIAEHRTGSAVPTTDSLWLTRAELTPVRWVATIDRSQLGASFAHDSIFGALQNYAGRSSFAAPLLPGVLVTPGMTERILEMLPLRSGYRAAASLVLVDMGTPRALPAELVVEREERIRTASGDVDCWVVVLRAGVMEERLWVDKSRRMVVRTEQVTSAGRVVSEL
ncbi:MAG TPA: hypothetical protein VJT85_05560, partial [Gemmatimonadaceae bacterium]|nr:hypothetical protein [Gemmatimonadaceae bacterium]